MNREYKRMLARIDREIEVEEKISAAIAGMAFPVTSIAMIVLWLVFGY